MTVVHNLLEELHHREVKSISAPGPALIGAVAVVASVATAGAGGAVVAGIGIKTGTVVGTAMSAAVSSLTAQVATHVTIGVLSQQSPADILKQITSPETLKNIVVSGVTAGALQQISCVQSASNTPELLAK